MDTTPTPDDDAPPQAPTGYPSAPRALDDLALATPELVRAVEHLAQRFKTTRRLAVVSTATAVGLAAVVGVLLYLSLQLLHTQQQATKVRERVLCPFYTLLVVAEAQPHPAPTDPRLAKAQQVIQDSYKALNCATVTLQPPPH